MIHKSSKPLIAATVVLIVFVAAHAQSHETKAISVRLGETVVFIPAPAGFEEVTSEFGDIKERFIATEATQNDMLVAFLQASDCELAKRGEKPLMNQYAKVSVLRIGRELTISSEAFAQIVNDFRKNGAKMLDPNDSAMKELFRRADENLTRLNSKDTKIELSEQPQNLGEFDVRPNVYSVMLLMPLKVEMAGNTVNVLVLATMTYLRIKEKVIFVYGYKKYSAKGDVETLRDFSKNWYNRILAAN